MGVRRRAQLWRRLTAQSTRSHASVVASSKKRRALSVTQCATYEGWGEEGRGVGMGGRDGGWQGGKG